MYRLTVTERPPAAPVETADLVAHARVPDDEADAVLAYAAAAADALEAAGLPALCTGYRLAVSRGSGRVALPRRPVVSVTAVRRYDADGTETALAEGTDYALDAAAVVLAPEWWADPAPTAARVEVEFTAGFGATPATATAADVPPAIRTALARRAATLYDVRSDVALGTVAAHLDGLTASLLAPYLHPSP